MSRQKVLLINPPLPKPHLPLSLLFLAAFVKDVADVDVLDLTLKRMGKQEFTQRILGKDNLTRQGYTCVGITSTTLQISYAYQIADWIKRDNPDITVVMGGSHVSFLADEAIGQHGVDLVVHKEGEATFREVLLELENAPQRRDFSRVKGLSFADKGRTITNPPRELLPAAQIPTPDRGLVQVKDKQDFYLLGELTVSRGCPEHCIFCAAPAFWNGKVRRRPIEDVVAEIDEIVARYGVRFFTLTDEDFTANRENAMKFCEAVADKSIYFSCFGKVTRMDDELLRTMKKAGCTLINYGVESGSQRILDLIKKRQTLNDIHRALELTRRAGIISNISVIVGHPYETEADLEMTYQLVKKLKPASFYAYPLQPLPGTELYEKIARETGEITAASWTDYFRWDRPIFIPNGLTSETIANYRRRIMKLAKRPDFILRKSLATIRHLDIREIKKARWGNWQP